MGFYVFALAQKGFTICIDIEHFVQFSALLVSFIHKDLNSIIDGTMMVFSNLALMAPLTQAEATCILKWKLSYV